MPLAFSSETRHRTKQQFVYRTIRDAIMECQLQPGERLVIDELARRLNVSAIPIREALQQLQSEALVVSVPHVGVTVAPISRDSVLDVFTVLEGLETVASHLVIGRASEADLQTFDALVSAMDAAVREGAHDEWANLNRRFHSTIAHVPGLPLLHEMTERVLDRWARVRRYFFRGVLVHRVDQAQEEHRAMVAAMRARDTRTLVEMARRHNQGALAAYMEYLSQNPDDSTAA